MRLVCSPQPPPGANPLCHGACMFFFQLPGPLLAVLFVCGEVGMATFLGTSGHFQALWGFHVLLLVPEPTVWAHGHSLWGSFSGLRRAFFSPPSSAYPIFQDPTALTWTHLSGNFPVQGEPFPSHLCLPPGHKLPSSVLSFFLLCLHPLLLHFVS